MDLNRIKNFVKQNGDKFILLEDGEPSVVVMSFPEYEKLSSNGVRPRIDVRSKNPRPSAQLADLETESLKGTEFVAPSPIRLEDIRLEDLPIE